MQVKRFFAENMRLALKMVREEMGPEAVILSSKRFDNGVEVLTAIDSDNHPLKDNLAERAANDNPFRDPDRKAPASPSQSRLERELEQMQKLSQQRARSLADSMAKKPAPRVAPKPDSSPTPEPGEAAVKPVGETGAPVAPVRRVQQLVAADMAVPGQGPQGAAATAAPGVENEVASLRRELQSMRDMLEQQLSSMAWGSYRQQYPRQASLWRRMKRMGLSAAIAHGLLESLGKKPVGDEQAQWQKLMAGLVGQLPVDDSDVIARGGVFVMVGPTGAGKTTTIGKLATRYVLEHGADQVALVTTDTARIAAYEHLRTFGRILNVPVKIVDRHTSLERVLFALRDKSLVLVDTAGYSRQDPRGEEQLRLLGDIAERVNTILTLPATSQKPVIKATYHAFKGANLAGCILTKLDEASSIGEVLSLAAEKQLPILYTTDGQSIPDNIEVADSRALIRRAIGLARSVASEDEAMADEVSALAGS